LKLNRENLIRISLACLLVTGVVSAATGQETDPADSDLESLSFSGDDPEKDQLRNNDDSPPGGDIWGTVIALAAVVTLIGLAGWLLKRSRHGSVGLNRNTIDVLAHKALTARDHLYLVRVGKRVVLIGSGQGGMSSLAEMASPDEVADLLEGLDSKQADRKPAEGDSGLRDQG